MSPGPRSALAVWAAWLAGSCALHRAAPSRADAALSTSCVLEPDLLVRGAGRALGHAPETDEPATCETHDNGRIVQRTLRACPEAITIAVERWSPDVIVGLGGGILAPHHAGCATQQRARAVQEFFERLDRRPYVILTGHGPSETPHALDAVEARCAAARLAQDAARERQAVPDDAKPPEALTRLTESEYMCAEILRAYPSEAWPAVLARIVFEPRAQSTVENAEFASAIIAERHLRRALVVSTPVVYAHAGEDNHPYRALCDFRAARAHYGAFHVAAVGCPFADDGAAWGDFE